MFTVASKKYTYPVKDTEKKLWKVFYKEDKYPMYLEVLKYEDSETGKPTYFYIEDGKLKVNDFKPEFLRKGEKSNV